ncbi:MAG: hypothetical protein EOO24_09705 [Comamonadaceae bacterium]|nr:MAG: hypothetical protein EOO24_09705 [Comamonadaceae bacterium]
MQRRDWLAGTAAGLLAAGAASARTAPRAAPSTPARDALRVEAVQMPAWTGEAGRRVPLAPGDAVPAQAEVETGGEAGLVLQLPEGSQLRLGEKTRLRIPALQAARDPESVDVQAELTLLQGFLRFTTSSVAKAVGRRRIDVGLRTATIGIRGTDFWAMTDDDHDAACLFEGRVELQTSEQGALLLERPTAFWTRVYRQPPQAVGNATPEQLQRFLGTTELKPGRGVAVAGGRWRVVAATLPQAQGAAARRLVASLREAGYPAVTRERAGGKPVTEVRINQLATRADAQAVLDKLAGRDGIDGRVALSA